MDANRFFGFLGTRFFWIPFCLVIVLYACAEVLLAWKLLSEPMLVRISGGGAALLNILAWVFANTQFGERARENIDKQNFQKFLELMPPNGMMRLFEEHWFSNRFSTRVFQDYDAFTEFYSRPGKNFLNSSLESDIRQFRTVMETLFEKLAGYTSPVGSGESGFPPEIVMYEHALFEQRAAELDELSKKAALKYREMVDKWSTYFCLPH